MPDESGKLTTADIPIIEAFMAKASLDNCLSCPVTGVSIPITAWQISDRLCMLPTSGQFSKANLANTSAVISCFSPAGSIVFLDALRVGLVTQGVSH